MSPRSTSGGEHWDPAEIRREREFAWFREHEAEMIESARRRRIEAEQARARGVAGSPSAGRSAARLCPNCSRPMGKERLEEIEVEKCPSCDGIFFDRGELESLLLRHDEHRRGFFRRLLGFEAHPSEEKPEV